MTCLSLIKNNLNISDSVIEEIKGELQHVENVLQKYNITFKDAFDISFYNHVISFIERAKTGKFVEPIGEEMVGELTEESINIATELLQEIFNKYKREVNKSEIYLVAIHIQVALREAKMDNV